MVEKYKSRGYLKCSADIASHSKFRGNDCIDRFYLLVISEKESESRQEEKMLLMQKHAINHCKQFVPNEK